MKKVDFSLLFSIIILTLFGLLMIYDASSYSAFRNFGDKYHFVKDQFFWAILGISGLTFFSYFDYKKIYYMSLPILLIALVLLAAVFIPGIGIGVLGAHRWISIGTVSLQPAEFVKLALAIYLAAWFSNKEKGRLFAFSLLLLLVLSLVILEPDMGTTIVVLAEAMAVYFLSGGRIFYFVMFVPILLAAGFLMAKISPYRAKRLEAFFNLGQSIESSSYHVRQILIALGSGGFLGVGLGNSLQKYAYLPESTTDSIFAIIAEELGFVGATVIIIFFIFILWRCFYIARHTKDKFGKLLAGGISTFLAVQTIVNLSSQTALLPLTGIPLPFISYGGSSLIVDLCSIGILLNISKQINLSSQTQNMPNLKRKRRFTK